MSDNHIQCDQLRMLLGSTECSEFFLVKQWKKTKFLKIACKKIMRLVIFLRSAIFLQ